VAKFLLGKFRFSSYFTHSGILAIGTAILGGFLYT